MPDELKLNSISRFSKTSPRLHLEEHGHCEVPAGCGGVVLRWYNPARATAVLFVILTPTRARLFLNGAPPASARPLLPIGNIVLALEFDAIAPGQGLFMLAGARSKTFRFTEESICVVRSVADGSWRCNVSPPPAGWMLPEFDSNAWPELVERPVEPPKADDYRGAYAQEQLVKLGARPLGLPEKLSASQVWVRKVFTNPAESSA